METPNSDILVANTKHDYGKDPFLVKSVYK